MPAPDSSLPSSSAPRVSHWQLRTARLELGRRPRLMGILNVTPDSFSDGGKFVAHQAAIEHALQLVEDGADILDIGGESTRPYATPVPVDAELQRVIPVIEAVRRECAVPISIDTSKAAVAEAALDAGAEIVNDVTGLEGDPEMGELCRRKEPGVCVMHMQGTPQTMQDDPRYANVVEEIYEYLRRRRDRLTRAGLKLDRICLDPGIGFGKTHEHNITLAAHCHRFLDLECPVLVGHSRKGFIAKLIGDKQADRTHGTLGVSLALAVQGVHLLRVHDVRATRDALRSFEACGGLA